MAGAALTVTESRAVVSSSPLRPRPRPRRPPLTRTVTGPARRDPGPALTVAGSRLRPQRTRVTQNRDVGSYGLGRAAGPRPGRASAAVPGEDTQARSLRHDRVTNQDRRRRATPGRLAAGGAAAAAAYGPSRAFT